MIIINKKKKKNFATEQNLLTHDNYDRNKVINEYNMILNK